MTPLQYLKRFLLGLPAMSRQTGFSPARLAAAYAVSYIFHGANSEEFCALRLYEMTNKRRSQFLLYRDTVRFSDALNAGASKEELACFDDKYLFNQTFRAFIRRDWLYLPESSVEDVQAFLRRNATFLAKERVSTQGKGITKHAAADTDAAAFMAQRQGQPLLLEAFLTQHPAMAAPNPSTVNTVRIQTARKGDEVILLGGCMRCGGADAFVDNFHKGGVAYPLDMATGIVTGPGRTLKGDALYIRHPSTGHTMPGFQVPFWEELVSTVRRAAVTVPHVGYVGWDVAVTPDGPELIEGNINYPDPIVVQLDGGGRYQTLKAFAKP